MLFIDPSECVAARDCLQRDNPAEAARLLLESKHPGHRGVRQLLLETAQRLVALAEEQLHAGHVEAAEDTLRLASRCVAPDGKAMALRRQVAKALEEKQARAAHQAAQLDEAERLAAAGHLQAALDVLALLGDCAPAAQLRASVEQRLARFTRNVAACRQCLEAGQAQAAHRHWQAARDLAPHDPQLAELAEAIARGMQAVGKEAAPSVPLGDRAQRFMLGQLALVVSTSEVCVGTSRGEGVHVPIIGALHGRHALFLHDRAGWQLSACRDRHGQPCRVWIGARRIDTASKLVDGDTIELGGEPGRPSCVWQFRLPVPGSATAVLEPGPAFRALARTSGGNALARVILLDDALLVRASGPAHLVLPELPCEQLALRWKEGRLHWEVKGGCGRLELPGRTIDEGGSQLYLPCRLVIEPQLDEAELLGRAVAGCEPAERLVLELADPSAFVNAAR